jgi:hypothetical protein
MARSERVSHMTPADPASIDVSPVERLYRHIDKSIARSIDSRFPGLVQDPAKAIATELRDSST